MLNQLGKHATNADILYGTEESLEKKLNEIKNLQKKIYLKGKETGAKSSIETENKIGEIKDQKEKIKLMDNRYSKDYSLFKNLPKDFDNTPNNFDTNSDSLLDNTYNRIKSSKFKSAAQKEKIIEQIKSIQTKNELLSELGENATPADILYGTPESLQQKLYKLWASEVSYDEIGKYLNINGDSSANVKWQRPVNYTKVSSPYGLRFHPIEHKYKKHNGVDLKVVQGTVVKAFSSGKVEFAGTMKGYGYVIVINHGNWNGKIIKTKYAHLSKFNVKKGDTIDIGANIGLSGGKPGTAGAGGSTGQHLHFEVLENNVPVDPMKYLNKH